LVENAVLPIIRKFVALPLAFAPVALNDLVGMQKTALKL
jgi:hypothetical protein